jgi:hypothetical protein
LRYLQTLQQHVGLRKNCPDLRKNCPLLKLIPKGLGRNAQALCPPICEKMRLNPTDLRKSCLPTSSPAKPEQFDANTEVNYIEGLDDRTWILRTCEETTLQQVDRQ